MRRALGLVIAGLTLQLIGAFFWSPGTFVMSASLGAPLVLLGVIIGALAAAASSGPGPGGAS